MCNCTRYLNQEGSYLERGYLHYGHLTSVCMFHILMTDTGYKFRRLFAPNLNSTRDEERESDLLSVQARAIRKLACPTSHLIKARPACMLGHDVLPVMKA